MIRFPERRLSLLLIFVALITACTATTGNGPTAVTTAVTSTTPMSDALLDAQTRFEYPAIVSRLENTVAESPTDVTARLSLVYGYLKTGQYHKARPEAEWLQQHGDRLGANAKLWLAALRARIDDDSTREIAAWRRVVAANPRDRWAHYELAAALSMVEDYAGAAVQAARALQIEPDPGQWEASWVHYLLSKALTRSGQHEQAIAVAEASSGNATTWRSTYFRMALAQIAAGDAQLAETFADDYRQVSIADGRNNESYTEANIALFFYELGDYERAIGHARKAYELDPKGYQSWALAYNLTENGLAREGLQIMDKAAAEFPNDPHVLAARGWTLYRMGRHEEAREMLIEAQANSERKIFYIDRIRETIEAALNGGDAKARAPWLG